MNHPRDVSNCEYYYRARDLSLPRAEIDENEETRGETISRFGEINFARIFYMREKKRYFSGLETFWGEISVKISERKEDSLLLLLGKEFMLAREYIG